MKILLFGKNGQVGWELNRTLLCLGELIAFDYPEVDFENPKELIKIIDEIKPALIVNAVAYTNVDKAEEEPKKAQLINAITPGEIAKWCKNHDAVLIHYSTDYVFDGTKGTPYTEEDEPKPINVYGKTKLEGEKAIQESGAIHLILRTAWVYSMRGNNFVTKVLEWAKKSNEIRVVDDQISNPTWARALAEITANIITMGITDVRSFFKDKGGLYHCAGSGYCSRYEWAKFILENSSIKNINLLPAKSGDFINSAKRPCYSALFSKKLYQSTGLILPSWKLNLILALSQKENKLFQTH